MTAVELPPIASRKITKRADTPSLSGTSASAATASESIAMRRNCRTASAPTRISVPVLAAFTVTSAASSAGNRCASLASSIAAAALAPALTLATGRLTRTSATSESSAAALALSGSARPCGPTASSPSARARLAVTTTCNCAGVQSWRKAASRSSVIPSIGKTATDPEEESMTTGRAERNSAKARSTAI